MPFGDRTGPMGYGPMTGRGAGYCAGYPVPGFMNPYMPRMGMGWGRGFGRGRGWGRGRGFGRGWWGREPDPYYDPTPYYGPYPGGTYPEPSPEEEKTYLEDVVKSLETELKSVRDRLKELSKPAKK